MPTTRPGICRRRTGPQFEHMTDLFAAMFWFGVIFGATGSFEVHANKKAGIDKDGWRGKARVGALAVGARPFQVVGLICLAVGAIGWIAAQWLP